MWTLWCRSLDPLTDWHPLRELPQAQAEAESGLGNDRSRKHRTAIRYMACPKDKTPRDFPKGRLDDLAKSST